VDASAGASPAPAPALLVAAAGGGGTCLDLALLRRLTERPPLFAPHQAPFWDDPYIAKQMLAAHLDPSTDAASRRPETIDRIITWLVAHLNLRPGQAVLDLGCGPGLYCARLARLGLAVTGVDLSANSIAYARRAAAEAGLPIDYRCQDYLGLEDAQAFDAIFIIYYDFGVLSDAGRDSLLARVHRALKPGGMFVFDVTTPDRPVQPDGSATWAVRMGGFWRPGAYLELTRYFVYPTVDADLRQTAIVDADGRIAIYRIWNHAYTPATIEPVLSAHGLHLKEVWADLAGTPYTPAAPTIGIVARRR
jgi:SAM-dependent methyltransferase